jgi:hypothetical protein
MHASAVATAAFDDRTAMDPDVFTDRKMRDGEAARLGLHTQFGVSTQF